MRALVIAVFIGLSISCFGQGMSYSTIRTPHGNATVGQYSPSMMNYSEYNPKRKLTVVLNNDTTILLKTKISIGLKPQAIRVKVDRKKKYIVPNDTKEVSWVTLEGRRITGIPADSCWLFSVAEGKINSFSNIPVRGAGYAIAIQYEGSGSIVPLTVENLKRMTADIEDPEFNKLLTKSKASAALKRYYEIATKAP